MIVTTLTEVPDRRVRAVLGIAHGSATRTPTVWQGFMAGVRAQAGGENSPLAGMVNDARDAALREMELHAGRMGADAVVAFRVELSTVSPSAVSVIAYGTAVRLV